MLLKRFAAGVLACATLAMVAATAQRMFIITLLRNDPPSDWPWIKARHPRLRAAALYLAGRASSCSAVQALGSVSAAKNLLDEAERIRRDMRLQRTEGAYSLWDTPQGEYWFPADSELRYLAVMLAEQALDNYRGVQPGDVVLDCGANVGAFTRTALKRGSRLVVAIEPGPENVECLRRTFAGEIAAWRVIVKPVGVWDSNGMLRLGVVPTISMGDSFVLHGGSGPAIPVTTVDALVRELELHSADFIKMDIEGSEKNALRGAAESLRRFKPRMAISGYHLPEDPFAIPRLVLSLNPAYAVGFGYCKEFHNELRPEVIEFR